MPMSVHVIRKQSVKIDVKCYLANVALEIMLRIQSDGATCLKNINQERPLSDFVETCKQKILSCEILLY